jgi:hypothetical protein
MTNILALCWADFNSQEAIKSVIGKRAEIKLAS